jgi:hypothetical protein
MTVRAKPRPERPKEVSRLDECHRRFAAGCGGHHELDCIVAGLPIVGWMCRPDCPNREECSWWLEQQQ